MKNLLRLFKKERKNRNFSSNVNLFNEQTSQLNNISWSETPKTSESFVMQSVVDTGVFDYKDNEYSFYVTYEQTLDRNLRMIYCWFRVFVSHENDRKEIGCLKGAFFDNAFQETEWQKKGLLELIEIESDFQNLGLGSHLLKIYLNYVINLGAKTVTAKKARYSEQLVRFYRRFGFEINGRDIKLDLAKYQKIFC
ncbi:MAG: GNAT family N-acetyltransferase [Turicibacter sp.]|nr:GNAT family N-acetyltransferase [Turicibacter sp.]